MPLKISLLMLALLLPSALSASAVPVLEVPGRDELVAIQKLVIDKNWIEARRRVVALLKTNVDGVVVQAAVRLHDLIPPETGRKFAFEKYLTSLETGIFTSIMDTQMTGHWVIRGKTAPESKIKRIRIRGLSYPTDLLDSKRDCHRSLETPQIDCHSRRWQQAINGPGLYEIRIDGSAGETVDHVVLSEADTDPHMLNFKRPGPDERSVAPKIRYEIGYAGGGRSMPDEIRISLNRGTGTVKEWKWTHADFKPSGILESPTDGSFLLSLLWKKQTHRNGVLSISAEGWTGRSIFLSKAP